MKSLYTPKPEYKHMSASLAGKVMRNDTYDMSSNSADIKTANVISLPLERNKHRSRVYEVVLMTYIILVGTVVVNGANTDPPENIIALRDCQDKCGNVSIPYPFGIGKGCYYNNDFEIMCNNTITPSKPISGNKFEVSYIPVLDGQIRMYANVARGCYMKNGTLEKRNFTKSSTLAVFTINTTANLFVATGCDTYAWFKGERRGTNYSTGCMTKCYSLGEVENGTCSGVGCCMAAIPDGVDLIRVKVRSFDHYKQFKGEDTSRCSSAFVVASDSFEFNIADLRADYDQVDRNPVVYDWAIGTEDCVTAKKRGGILCEGNAECQSMPPGRGYRCHCLPGFSGNPYLPHGCQDVNECDDSQKNNCVAPAVCVNSFGNYTCHCPKGQRKTKDDRCVALISTTVKITSGVGVSIVVLIVAIVWLCWRRERKQLAKARETFFRQNGGHILLERLSQREMGIDMLKIFPVEEIEKSTNGFSDESVIGRGAFGTVYKGVLANNQVVAIKKSLKLESAENEQFVNEIIVLSRLNNRHVVKLFGCCLETEVPLLVYEYVDNGTLYDHLHEERKVSLLTWDVRLRIVFEVAEVLSYLHTTISIPIIHRDIKSMNILLDKKYAAKLSDFGASRLVPVDQDQFATMVLGTLGYLDPEYLQTSELTHKSDVYSFGVVLVEILTRQNAVSCRRPDNDRLLAHFFVKKLKEDTLLEILDENIIKDGIVMDQLKEVAFLARRCLKLKGEDRPTMKDVAIELERIARMTGTHPWANANDGRFEEETKSLLRDTKDVDYHGHSLFEDLGTLENGR